MAGAIVLRGEWSLMGGQAGLPAFVVERNRDRGFGAREGPIWATPSYTWGNGASSTGIETTMTLTITLPDHIRAYIERQIAEGRFDSEEAVIVGVFEHVIGEYRWEDDPELLAAIAEADRGEVFELTPQLRADIRRQSEENLKRGHQIRNDIKYGVVE